MKELSIPPGVEGDAGAVELIRFWISGGADHVNLNVGLFAADDEPTFWGSIIADIAKHAVNAMMQEDPSRDEQVLLAQIESGFAQRLAQTVNFTGQLSGRRQ
jgi:hypothetical protein